MLLPDPLTLWLVLVGAVALALWYGSRHRERRRDSDHLVKGAPAMAHSADDRTDRDLMVNLPARLDEHWLTSRVSENIELFRSSDSLLERWLLALRDRYSTPWDLQILRNAREKLQEQIALMNVAVQHRVTVRTMSERVQTGVLEQETNLFNARVTHDEAEARADGRVKTAALKADNEALTEEAVRAELKQRRAAAEKASRDLKAPPAPPQKPSRAEILRDIEATEAFQQQKGEAKRRGRLTAALRERERLRRERDERIAAIRGDTTLSEDDKNEQIEEIEDTYAEALGRGV